MKAKIKVSHATKYLQDSKIMQLSDFTELSDQELELLGGGGYGSGLWGNSTNTTKSGSVGSTS